MKKIIQQLYTTLFILMAVSMTGTDARLGL